MEQEVNMKMTCIAIQTSEKASQAFIQALQKFNAKVKGFESNKTSHHSNKEPVGKMVKVKDLRKDGSQIEFVDMGKDNMKDFRKYARRYGVSYSMEKNVETVPPTYLIYFKAKDSILINKAISEYVADKMRDTSKNKESVAEKLIVAKNKAAEKPDKIKNKEQVR